MSLATALLTPILGDASPWTPRRLFQLGEAGGVYDPSDLTAEKVAWRRNLLTWSEDFTNAAWTKTRSSITPNAGTSWDGTATASKLVEDTSTNTHIVQFVNVSVGGTVGDTTPYCFSVYAKAAERTAISLFDNGQSGAGTGNSSFDLSAGTVISGTGQIVAVGGGWYRCIIFPSRTAGTLATPQVRLLGPGNVTSYTGDGTSGVLIDSAQLEQSGPATAYQRITDFTSDFLAAFPTHGLYQDAAGTTPVTALGQPVGLVIDSKTGGLASIGATVLANGDFASGASWTAGTGWSIAAGVATKTAGTASVLSQAVTLTIPGTYRLIYTMTRSAGTLTPRITGGTTVNATARSASGTYTEYVTTVTGNTTFEFSADASFAGTVDDVTLQLVPGVHAIQPTNSSRPLLDGRVNLLNTTALLPGTGNTVTSNVATAPDGTVRAQRIAKTDTTTPRYAEQNYVTASVTANASYTASRYFKYDGHDTTVSLEFNNSGNFGVSWIAVFNVTASNIAIASQTNCIAAVSDAGGGWYRCSATFTTGTITVPGSAYLTRITGTTGVSVQTFGGDLRLTADNSYPFQFVASATDYADVGVPRSFLFDGFDDSLYTASTLDLSGTDKVTVWAGVYKNSDAASGVVVEHSTGVPNNRFALRAPQTAAANYGYTSGGTAVVTATTSNVYAAPNSSVLSGVSSIADDICLLRLNGAQVATDATDQGTGNYGNNVLFIGRRNNASLPLNGKAYQLIVRGALTDAATLAQAERYVGAKTGIFL